MRKGILFGIGEKYGILFVRYAGMRGIKMIQFNII